MNHPDKILLVIPLGLAITHLIALNGKEIKGFIEYLRSFAAGFSVAYVFLLLLPELPTLGTHTNVNTYLYSLIGFTVFHEAHKLIFQQKRVNKKALLDEAHLITAGLYNFLITFFLIELTRENLVQGLLITVIIALHTVLSELSQPKAIVKIKQRAKLGVIMGATLLGGIFALAGGIAPAVTATLFAFTSGAIVYIAIREEIPSEDRGRPFYFVIGVISLIIFQTLFL